MFQRTFSFWRRLVGQDEGGTACVAQEERRLWVRYEADAEAAVQLTGTDSERVSARVRDISLGGVNLIVDRPLKPGKMLSIELPAAEDEKLQLVLACVVYVSTHDEGLWSLGCAFSRELTPADLNRFGADAPVPTSKDQRQWERYPCQLKVHYQKIGELGIPPCTAEVLNISTNGIGLLVQEFVEPGTLLNLELLGKDGQCVRTILACVVHSTSWADGELAVGCNFIRELSEAELHSLL